jgi:hypothetical protein
VENWRGELQESFFKPLEDEGINYDSGRVQITFKASKL